MMHLLLRRSVAFVKNAETEITQINAKKRDTTWRKTKQKMSMLQTHEKHNYHI
jgi:hypothetical protein